PNFRTQPFIWQEGSGFSLLPVFGSGDDASGMAEDLNHSNDVVGAAFVAASGTIQAVAWPAAAGIVGLNGTDPNTSVALAINSGRIAVGWTTLSNGDARGTVWNISQVHPPTASSSPVQRRGRWLASPTKSQATACLRARTALVTKTRLVACLESRGL
ncbi:MAG TPA: hypothetical protein VHJ69_10060, partial [Gemmatimonadales bacterium]|nr:hypothetical protein [Gemmatimonadales bacterium]